MAKWLSPDFGLVVPPTSIGLPRALAIVHHVGGGHAQFARIVETARSGSGIETIVLELDVEVPSAPAHDIRPVERIAVCLSPADSSIPEALALRDDFPEVPHLNLRSEEFPRSLCLYEQVWTELKFRWTAASFVERIRTWLAQTARGELHAADQPLEPILLGWDHHLVLPADIFAATAEGDPGRLHVQHIEDGAGPGVLIARRLNDPLATARDGRWVATVFKCTPQSHGVIRKSPQNLADLQKITAAAGLDLLTELRSRLIAWREAPDIFKARVILIIWFPKTRSPGAEPEASDLWAFALHKTVEELAPLLNAWDQKNVKAPGLILNAGFAPNTGETVPVSLLNPGFMLSRSVAALLNGTEEATTKVVAVGAGALGSQLLLNLVRCGFGTLTVIDGDRLFPHNLARHALDGYAVGFPKAPALSDVARSILHTEPAPKSIVVDVLDPGTNEKPLADALQAAEVILDLSASVPVARSLCRDRNAAARRVSVFLSPSGQDLVLLAEDAKRSIPLDHLEHQFYREVLRNPALEGHLKREDTRVRYAQSCRDVSSTLPQHLAALHAAIASKALRDVLSQPAAAIRVWRADQDMGVKTIELTPRPIFERDLGGWRVAADEQFFQRIAELRRGKLPNETGGVLIGSFDLQRKIIYLADTIPSPPDSKEWPTLYIRGSEGLAAEVKRLGEVTNGMLQYVGEWHSHPRKIPGLPSDEDCMVFAWLTELMDRDGFPAVMLIEADEGSSVFVGRMERGERPA